MMLQKDTCPFLWLIDSWQGPLLTRSWIGNEQMTLCQIFGSVGATINQELPSPPVPVDQLSTYQILPEVSRPGNKREKKQQIWTIFLWLDWSSTTCNLNWNLWLWAVGHHCGERPQVGRWKRGKGRMIHGMGSKASSERWEWLVKGWPEMPAGHSSLGNVWGWAKAKGQFLLWGPGAAEGACVDVYDACPH